MESFPQRENVPQIGVFHTPRLRNYRDASTLSVSSTGPVYIQRDMVNLLRRSIKDRRGGAWGMNQ